MTRYELEDWCEKFLKDIFENSKPARDLMVKAVKEDWDEEDMQKAMVELMSDQKFKDYAHYKKELADFIVDFASQHRVITAASTDIKPERT